MALSVSFVLFGCVAQFVLGWLTAYGYAELRYRPCKHCGCTDMPRNTRGCCSDSDGCMFRQATCPTTVRSC